MKHMCYPPFYTTLRLEAYLVLQDRAHLIRVPGKTAPENRCQRQPSPHSNKEQDAAYYRGVRR